jgi:hypothetical protein
MISIKEGLKSGLSRDFEPSIFVLMGLVGHDCPAAATEGLAVWKSGGDLLFFGF